MGDDEDRQARIRTLEDRMTRVEGIATATAAAVTSHETVCAVRYQGINEKLDGAHKRIGKIGWGIIAMLLMSVGQLVPPERYAALLEILKITAQ